MVIFENLLLWMDPVKRAGPEAMAVDELLLETAEIPVLRVYQWEGEWGSLGYFGKIEEARASISGVRWVRRWTGGGLVDHRHDWTYSLVIPETEKLAKAKGAESYEWIHRALAETLQEEGQSVKLSNGGQVTGAALCFENPVGHDLVGKYGRKLAGAGQRRTRRGLLHQGSVALPCKSEISYLRAQRLAGHFASSWQIGDYLPDGDDLEQKISMRYADSRWTEKC